MEQRVFPPSSSSFLASYHHWLEGKRYLWATCAAVIVVTFFFWPWFVGDPMLFFRADGAVSYFTYKLIYTELTASGTFPLWNFGMLYGQPMQYTYIAIGPTKYLTMGLGAVFSVTDVYSLFQVTVLLELAVLVIGMMLLAKHMQIDPLAAVIAAVSLALMSEWFFLYYFRHDTLIVLPLLFYYGIRFAEGLDLRFLALGGLLMSLFFFDGVAYQPILFFYQMVVFLVITVLCLRTYRYIGRRPHYLKHPLTIAMSLGCVVLAGLFIYLLRDLYTGDLVVYRWGRSSDMSLSLMEFQQQLKVQWSSILAFTGMYVKEGNFHAAGPVLIVFFLSAIYHSSRVFMLERRYVMAIGIFMIISTLAISGNANWVSNFYYFLPGMHYYRYGDGFLTYAIAAFAIIAMFGMNQFLKNIRRGIFSSAEVLITLGLSIVTLFLLSGTGIFGQDIRAIEKNASQFQLMGFSALLVSFIVILLIKPRGNRWATLMALLLLTINVAVLITSYTPRAYALVHQKAVDRTLALPDIVPPHFRDDGVYHRINFTNDIDKSSEVPIFLKRIERRQRKNILNAASSIPFVNTSYNALFLSAEQLHACVPLMDSVTISKRLDGFFRLYAGFDDYMMTGLVLGLTGGQPSYKALEWLSVTPNARRILGCTAPVVRLAKETTYADNEEAAAEVLRQSGNAVDVMLTSSTEQAPSMHGPRYAKNTSAGMVVMKKYWGNEISFTARNSAPEKKWAIIADTFDEHWRAWVNGRPEPVRRANIAFKAVEVPPGESQVVLRYRNYGALISVWSAAILTSSLFLLFVFVWIAELGNWRALFKPYRQELDGA